MCRASVLSWANANSIRAKARSTKAARSSRTLRKKKFPTTTAEDTSLTGVVSRGVGDLGVQVATALPAGPMAPLVFAGQFAAGSGGSTFDEALHGRAEQVRNNAAFSGMAPEEQDAAYKTALSDPANLEAAIHAAGWSATASAALGVLPLGVILRPVARTAPGLVGWATGKLMQAGQSGIVFASVGEAQQYINQQIAHDYYDPTAAYSPDMKRMLGSAITGGVLGMTHPLGPQRQSSPEELAAFTRDAQNAPNANAPPNQTRADIDEFIRKRDAGWTYDNQTGQWTAPQADPNLLRLPAPTPDPNQPAAAAPAPEPPPRPAAPTAPIDSAFPSLDEPGRASPPAPPDNPFNAFDPPQEQPNDRQAGQQVSGAVREGQEPGNVQQQGPGGAPLAAGGILQTPAPTQGTENPAPPNVGHAKLSALLNDPRTADEIRADAAVDMARSDAAHAQGIRDAAEGAVVPQETFAPAPVDLKVNEAPGTRQAPVNLEQPQDVTLGAERTGSPTPAQAEAGNYTKRHVRWNGLQIAVETEAGQERRGIGPDGVPWAVTLTSPYGYIKRTLGRDGDQVDVYLGPEPKSPYVYIVDQIDHRTGGFDEHKAMLGFPDEASARTAYHQAFSDGNGPARIGALRALARWLNSRTGYRRVNGGRRPRTATL